MEGNDVEGVLCIGAPWPSIARSVYKDHARYLETYMKPYPGYCQSAAHPFQCSASAHSTCVRPDFTGDGAGRDKDGYIWIKGRVDGALLPRLRPLLTRFADQRAFPDVINVSGHRLSTAEIESALIMHSGVAETAVVGTADELTGQAVYAFGPFRPALLSRTHVYSHADWDGAVTMKPEFDFKTHKEADLLKELVMQVRKSVASLSSPRHLHPID